MKLKKFEIEKMKILLKFLGIHPKYAVYYMLMTFYEPFKGVAGNYILEVGQAASYIFIVNKRRYPNH